MSSNKNPVYQKHLTLLDREDIERMLKADFKFYQISDRLRKDPTTISKEIKKIVLSICHLILIIETIIVNTKPLVL